MRDTYPILEYDPERRAIIEPRAARSEGVVPERAVACFFQDVITRLAQKEDIQIIARLRSEIGTHPVYQLQHNGQNVAIFHPGVGAPLAAGLLEEVIALGCRKFIACGGAGVLDSSIALGHVIVPSSAVRDEGTSYHYLPPAREVTASREAVETIEKVLREKKCDYLVAKTWTTDAIYRETVAKVRRRRDEGCLTVEMEAAAFFAVAQFRDVLFGQILYGGDDLGGEQWDSRQWDADATTREKLFWLSVEACLALP